MRIAEPAWRAAVEEHVQRIKEMLQPGLTPTDHSLNTGSQRKSNRQSSRDWLTALDPKNPVYNFLIEYYGLKGLKGTKRLVRWSPM